MKSTRKALLALVVGGLALVSAACNGASTATITLSEFQIKTRGIAPTVGQPFAVTLVNGGKVEHNLELDPKVADAPLLAVLKPGESTKVVFTPKTVGSFGYACTIPGHAPAGMIGTFSVHPAS